MVGIAANSDRLEQIDTLKPDIVTLDVEMPEMDGIETLRAIQAASRSLPVIMFSLTEAQGPATLEALSLGASDRYVTKPANVGSVTAAMDGASGTDRRSRPSAAGTGNPTPPPPLRIQVTPTASTGRCDVVAIGSSTGGPSALSTVFGQLPASFDKPIVIAQHMPAVFTRYLAQRLDAGSRLQVRRRYTATCSSPVSHWCAGRPSHDAAPLFLGVTVVLDQEPAGQLLPARRRRAVPLGHRRVRRRRARRRAHRHGARRT
ncbi:MAG: response regulator [Ilumatobacteraceae bacterium]